MAFLETLLSDPELERETLEAANAAYFPPSRPSPRMQEAVTVLGTRLSRYVSMIAGVRGRLLATTPAPAGFDRPAFWRHCVATGFAAESLARSVGAPLPETAFVAGLLHDVGLLVLDRNDPAALADVIALRAQGHDQARIEQEVVGATHAEIGRTAGRMWGLPPVVTDAVTAHHDPASGTGSAFRVAALVRAADWLTSEPGTVWSSDIVDVDDPLLREMGIGLEASDKAVHEATARLDELSGLLNLDPAGAEPATDPN
jgi:putative nucleotidyltransferase with HDIG domain